MAKADEAAGESEESLVNVVATFVADTQATTTMQPGQGTFHDPAMATKPLTRFDATTCDARADATPARGSIGYCWRALIRRNCPGGSTIPTGRLPS